MVQTLSAVRGQERRRLIAIGTFAIGSLFGSASLGAVLSFAGAIVQHVVPSAAAMALLAAVAFVASLLDLELISLPRPQRSAQVPSAWRNRWPLAVASFGYGVVLGIGILTFIPFAAFYVVLVAGILFGFPLGVYLMLGYGAGKAVMTVVLSARPSDPERVPWRKLMANRWAVALLNGTFLAVITGCLAWEAQVAWRPI
jgi:cytochrome c biogenesis protein CcdA